MGKLIGKLVQLDEKDKKAIDKLAKEKRMSSNQLIRLIIENYLKKEV